MNRMVLKPGKEEEEWFAPLKKIPDLDLTSMHQKTMITTVQFVLRFVKIEPYI